MSTRSTPSAAVRDTHQAPDSCYLALKAHDARFDGSFFTGVTSTGVYCRPVCRVRTPKRENCRFFTLAAQAEAAGFRPCLRCRPELAPSAAGAPWSIQDASSILARQAAALMDAPHGWSDGTPTLALLAAKLGVSERHLRRIFETNWGVSPLQYLQTRRLLTAKQLLTDTALPVAQIAGLSGYASLRRFNAAFVEHYRLQPRALRKQSADTDAAKGKADAVVTLKAAYRPPYDVRAMLNFFATRAIAGVENADIEARTLTRTLALAWQGQEYAGWVQAQFGPEGSETVHLRISETLVPALPAVLERLKAWLDLDADPQAIEQVLGSHFPGAAGLRVPSTLDGFELAVRGILGQQITVKAARTLGARLVAHYGATIETPHADLQKLFPSPQALASADGETLGQMGIVRQRQAALRALAQAVLDGELKLQPGADVTATLARLQQLPGIGAWTANYIAMRALRWPDAFPAGDVALQKALGVREAKQPALAAEQASAAWKPWRSYAVVRAWATLAAPPTT